ncbi:hypothetical protein SETIT_4G093000v2 [Setaria italica]|uniref:t-SNARE coiled-coil homology domain-containing protein n=2 Tax=Setaria TaxID=4554 RepID=A0A368QSI9_SETIT|nr:hypothetical protein SETIT_4G093000v2 [Setaria italica]
MVTVSVPGPPEVRVGRGISPPLGLTPTRPRFSLHRCRSAPSSNTPHSPRRSPAASQDNNDVFHHDLESGLPPRPPPPPQAVVAHCVFQINTKVSALRRLAEELAAAGRWGHGDSRDVRERIRRARAEATRLARNTARRLADPAAAATVGPRLAADFQAALGELQWVQGRIIEADRQETAAARRAFRTPSPPSYGSLSKPQLNIGAAGTGTRGADQQSGIQMQQQLVESRRRQELALLDNEITFNEALVEEREREICKIQQEISEINEIFRDLAKLVHGQQGAIDIVESNIETAAMETSKGEEQLTRAALTQESNSSMKCLLLTVFGLVMMIFALVFVT